jgi:glutamate-1-semialdehyde 2,1-aminomutase
MLHRDPMRTSKSQQLFQEASQILVGGVDSPVRAFGAVGSHPLFIERAEGATLYDVDGNRYLDYIGSWGPMILGHNHPHVVAALKEALDHGTSFGAPTARETELAQQVQKYFPSLEKIRFVNSGTEATMSALRASRGFTGKDKIIKLEGCYHGHADPLLVKAGSGATTLGVPNSAGVPASMTATTLVAPYNNIDALEALIEDHSGDIAALILEPAAGNMGFVPPQPDYLQTLRSMTEKENIVLIFDEVMTGFRLSKGGAQGLYKVTPDLTCLGKIIGGGLPVGAYGGRAEIMQTVSPEGPVYQAGTLSGNPLAMTAGIETLKILGQKDFYKKLNHTAKILFKGLQDIAKKSPLSLHCQYEGSMGTLFFTDHDVTNYSEALKCKTELFGQFFQGLLKRGIYFPPSQFEALFISAAHTEEDIQKTLTAAQESLEEIA